MQTERARVVSCISPANLRARLLGTGFPLGCGVPCPGPRGLRSPSLRSALLTGPPHTSPAVKPLPFATPLSSGVRPVWGQDPGQSCSVRVPLRCETPPYPLLPFSCFGAACSAPFSLTPWDSSPSSPP